MAQVARSLQPAASHPVIQDRGKVAFAGDGSRMAKEETEFEELKRYVGFGPEDEAELAALQARAEANLTPLLDAFYGTIARHREAVSVFRDPDQDIPRQRKLLGHWVLSLLQGPYDEAYAKRRAGIGRAHVRHRLPQRYMLSAMNIIRQWFTRLCIDAYAPDPERLLRALNAVNRILDIELALMLGTYRDDLLASMQRKERLATIGELAAGIQHELKNPLAAVSAAAFALGERRAVKADPRSRALLEHLQENVARASELIGDLLSFARLHAPASAPVSVDELVEAATLRISLPPRCRLILDLDPALPPVVVDKAQMVQVLINLLQNAVEACTDGGEIRVTSRLADGGVQIVVSDNGVGIDPADVERAFEPLYSTKPAGVGLGLSLSRHLAQANGADLRLAPRPGGGTDAIVTLKLASAAPATPPPSADAHPDRR